MPYVEGNSAIRAMFEEGARMAAEFGKENVYDFSLGNPSVPAPKEQEILYVMKNMHVFLNQWNSQNQLLN